MEQSPSWEPVTQLIKCRHNPEDGGSRVLWNARILPHDNYTIDLEIFSDLEPENSSPLSQNPESLNPF
jgi:hypothetical protein